MPEIKTTLVFASVADDLSGINLRLVTEKNELFVAFLKANERIGDINLVLRRGMDAKTELQKVCNILNGFTENEDGSLSPINNFQQKKITLVRD